MLATTPNPMGRRAFLGWAATGAAGLLLPTVVRPAPKVFDMGRGLDSAPRLRYARPLFMITQEGGLVMGWQYGYDQANGGTLWLPSDPDRLAGRPAVVRITDGLHITATYPPATWTAGDAIEIRG